MLKMYTKFQAMMATRDKGVTAAEYGMLLAVVVFVMAVGALVFGDKLDDLFRGTAEKVCEAPATCVSGD